jgi:SAM-dependent methyltransferase
MSRRTAATPMHRIPDVGPPEIALEAASGSVVAVRATIHIASAVDTKPAHLMDLDVNYRYFVSYVGARAGRPSFTVLDFGCGDGVLVQALRQQGIDCYGAEVFYPGGVYELPSTRELVERGIIRTFSEGAPLPFDDSTFDLVVSNQVFEHVEHLGAVVRELARILKQNGTAYHHFPSREVLREGHIGIPLAHRLPEGRLRFAYVALLRRLGLGSNKADLPIRTWTRVMLDWLDAYCYYRPYARLLSEFTEYFSVRHREIDYCRFRAADRPWLRRPLEIEPLRGFYALLFRRLAFMAVEMRKRPSYE